MRQNKFKKGDIINNLIILDKDKIVTTNNGSKKTYWICKCKICGSIKSKSTQTIENCKSCGCKQRERNGKVKNSGRKTKQGTNFYINCLISIYKSNAKKRNVKFDLEYTDFEKLINGECYYCGDVKSNKLIKKNYKPFYYNGIDRVNNEIGYTKENCVSCCEFCNKAKRNITIDEFYNKCYKIVNKKIELDETYFNIAKERIEKVEKLEKER